jgi:hypothetical protein
MGWGMNAIGIARSCERCKYVCRSSLTRVGREMREQAD